MSIRNKVKEILETRWKDLKNPTNLLSVYEIEKQTNKGYNGRQLLELFQNCEDEGASTVRIFLETETQTLKISNDGAKSFSFKGYRSIFYPGLSAKVSSGYIGNKGLGFRSIINWSNEVSIISNGFKIVFNENFKEDILANKLGYSENDLKEIRKERNFKDNVFPIPFLNSCKIDDLDLDHAYTTTIEIKYKKEKEADIVKQLESISEKTLLFLKNINTIQIEGDVLENTISVKRRKIDEYHSEITHEGEIFYVISDDGIVDESLVEDRESNEPKRYSVKIAYNNDLSFSDEVMYNYFKTQIPFELPFVVHASLELDQNRNHSTESKINDFVLEKLFQLHLRFIEVLKNRLDKSWLPYLSINNNDFDVYRPYSDLIDDYWEDFKVYPTLCGEYHTKEIAKDLGNGIAKFMEENYLHNHYRHQIIYCDLEADPNQYIDRPDDYEKIIEKIAVNLKDRQRAEYVKLLLKEYPDQKFSVLIDEKGQIIHAEDYVFTNKTSKNSELKVPVYSHIRFLNSELYKALISELELTEERNKGRVLKDRLEEISNVQSFEPQTVIDKIVFETKNFLVEAEDKQEILKEFYQTLFHNYQYRGENPLIIFSSVPCLNRRNKVKNINELVLSSEFEIGKKSKDFFPDLYNQNQIICELNKLGLENQDIDEVEEFLKWLGVNQFTIIHKLNSDIPEDYIEYIGNEHSSNITSYTLYSALNLEKIINSPKYDINQIVALISLDEQIKNIFSNFNSTYSNRESLSYSFRGTKYISNFENFIFYSISKTYNVGNYLITNKRSIWFNPFIIDYDYLKSINPSLEKNEVDRILKFLGAKQDFNQLDIEYLKEQTQILADKENHKGAQVFYKSLVSHYRENEEEILNANLYARVGNDIKVKNAGQIYYSDRIQLPESLTTKFPILYYPSRSGGTKAIELFGLKNLNELNLKMERMRSNELISPEFQIFLQEIKPFILAFRLDKITKEDVKKNQVQLLNKLKINCCEDLICSLEDQKFEIAPFDYIYINDEFYLNIPADINLTDLRKNKQFRDNLSDIFLKVFDTQDEKKTFETIIIQSKDDNLYDINNDLAEGILEEAKILLGEISIRLSIWTAIFDLKEIEVHEHLDDNNLEEMINQFFPTLDKDLFFISDDNLDQLRRIKGVFDFLGVDLIEYNSSSEYKISFDKLYNQEFKKYYSRIKKSLKDQIWDYLSSKEVAFQKQFIKWLYKIEHLFDNLEFKESVSNYDFEEIIISELSKEFPSVKFELNNDQYQHYNFIHRKNISMLSEDEELELRRDEVLNSLSYFQGQLEFIKSELIKLNVNEDEAKCDDFNINDTGTGDLVQDFEIQLGNQEEEGRSPQGPWLGDNRELNPNQKKKLGNKVEKIVEEYLLSRPDLYSQVEHLAKTNEGEHYDLRYYDAVEEKTKYVECKFYNGASFIISREEKKFADDNVDQFEIWLVNKDSKIFRIKDITLLGELKPVSYRVNLKLNEYAISN
ncbi:DUF3883 domain-containing protein [uncultured Christiangramia sp.]|uniref:sacsin N-terminal ATP-binding-like domain-containing protein n=1 Tax=uncultured Christiangramia sp. TaxID=503836 RepID=UPI0026224743|nr:DUF3883 domain-containing protein [uncultured Christiangramia sp.]